MQMLFVCIMLDQSLADLSFGNALQYCAIKWCETSLCAIKVCCLLMTASHEKLHLPLLVQFILATRTSEPTREQCTVW